MWCAGWDTKWQGWLIEASERRLALLRLAEHFARFARGILYPPQRDDAEDAENFCYECAPWDAYDFPEGEQLRWCHDCERLLVDELTPAGALDCIDPFDERLPANAEEWQELWVVLRTLPEEHLARIEAVLARLP